MFEVSAASHEGLRELTFAMAELVAAARAAAPAPEAPRFVLRPAAVDDGGFTVTPTDIDGSPAYIVRGTKPARWVRQTDFGNPEAVGYLADRLARLGVEDQLFELGAQAGDTVVVGGRGPRDEGAVVFDWEPSIKAGAEHLHGRRGTDLRLEGR